MFPKKPKNINLTSRCWKLMCYAFWMQRISKLDCSYIAENVLAKKIHVKVCNCWRYLWNINRSGYGTAKRRTVPGLGKVYEIVIGDELMEVMENVYERRGRIAEANRELGLQYEEMEL